MAMNDFIRIRRAGSSSFIEFMVAGKVQMTLKDGYMVLPKDPANPQSLEFGSQWADTNDGRVKIRDATGVKSL